VKYKKLLGQPNNFLSIKISIEKPAYKPENILKHMTTLNATISIHTCKIDCYM
jgi:hypothetical protein